MFKLKLDSLIEEIKQRKSKQVLVQLPDGLKNRSAEVVEAIEENTDAEVFIWLTSCFGACDVPLGLDLIKIDLLVQFGHNRYWKTKEW